MPLSISFVDKNNRPPTPLRTAEPQYSQEAKAVKFEGTVQLQLIVNEQGIPEDIRILKPVGHGLDEKAIEGVSGYRFSPALRWGIPVSYAVTIEVDFRLFR
jgi:TonB family protein